MSINYQAITVFTTEQAKYKGKPLSAALVERISNLHIAARCIVCRGIAGCYENGDIATHGIEVLSFNMPLKIEIIFPSAELQCLLPIIDEIVTDGIAMIQEMDSLVHRVNARLLPTNLRVMDIMTSNPRTVSLTATAADVIRILLAGTFNGLPVVDERNQPVGIVTQGDLIQRAGMPIRLGILRDLGKDNADIVMQQLESKRVSEIMTQPVATVHEDMPVRQAVELMLQKGLKRMPVISKEGLLSGMLARIDIFKTVTQNSPDWADISRHGIEVKHARLAADIMCQDVHKVQVSTSIEEVMRMIDDSAIQRVAVVDASNRLLGMISDRDLLKFFSGHHVGIWDRIASRLTFTAMGQRHKSVIEDACKRTAGEFMRTDIVSVREETSLDEVVSLMTSKQLKRLPVTGPHGELLGVISRDAVLRAGL